MSKIPYLKAQFEEILEYTKDPEEQRLLNLIIDYITQLLNYRRKRD